MAVVAYQQQQIMRKGSNHNLGLQAEDGKHSQHAEEARTPGLFYGSVVWGVSRGFGVWEFRV